MTAMIFSTKITNLTLPVLFSICVMNGKKPCLNRQMMGVSILPLRHLYHIQTYYAILEYTRYEGDIYI